MSYLIKGMAWTFLLLVCLKHNGYTFPSYIDAFYNIYIYIYVIASVSISFFITLSLMVLFLNKNIFKTSIDKFFNTPEKRKELLDSLSAMKTVEFFFARVLLFTAGLSVLLSKGLTLFCFVLLLSWTLQTICRAVLLKIKRDIKNA